MNCPYVMRRCKKCGEVKFLFKFARNKSSKYGFRKDCKECVSTYNKQYREDNKEEIAERKKKYYEEHKEERAKYFKQYCEDNKREILEKNKQYYKEHKEEITEKNKQYHEEHKEEIMEYQKKYKEEHKKEIKEYHKQYREGHKEEIIKRRKKHYENNKEEIKKKQKQYYKDNKEDILERNKRYRETPQGQTSRFNSHNKRRNKKQTQGNGITTTQWYEMMNFFEWKCAYSDMYMSRDVRSIDHIIALDNGGLNEIWNCVPMYRLYNSSKNKSDMLEWYQQQDFYSEERLQKIYEWQEYAYNKWNVNI